MSDKTKIEWSDATWNPVTGCTKISEGCRNCYALTFAERWRGTPGHYFEKGFDIVLRPDKIDQPLKWQRPRKIFVNSMSDLFHPDVPFDFIDQIFAVMALAPQHTFQILTKRPDRMLQYMTEPGFPWNGSKMADLAPYMEQWGWISPEDMANVAIPGSSLPKEPEWPLPNVWLGVSVENQKAADERIPLLLQTPAAVRWLSCEPLLGEVDIRKWTCRDGMECKKSDWLLHHYCPDNRIDWVVVGGESGHKARPMHPDWARSLRDQCQAAGVPFLFKQWGEWREAEFGVLYSGKQKTTVAYGYHRNVGLFRFGKTKAGRELDGRTWDEFPMAQKQPAGPASPGTP